MTEEQIQQAFDDIETAMNIPASRGGLSLTSWEEDFVESIGEQFEESGRISPKQCDVLQRIWKRT